MRIGIIGAGIAGLAASIRMASRGYEVTVFERNSYPGGKLAEMKLGKYRFDAGPSLFTMPMYVDELFELAQPAKTAPLQYERLPVVCNYFWDDGTRLSAYADRAKLATELQDKLGVQPESLFRALEDSRQKYELTGHIFLEKSLHKWSTWLTPKVGKALLQLGKLDIFKSMDGVNQKHFDHPKLIQFFNRFATYNGSNPYQASGILNIIPHFEHEFGAFFPEGGMFGITTKLYELAREKGVQFKFGKEVERILVQNGRAEGLQVDDETYSFDRVISNMDVFFTYRKLLPDQKQPEHILRREKSSSALIFYWGIKKTFPELDLHNIFFSNDYKAEFDHITAGNVYDDPTVYINITQKYASEDAPAGGENWFTMINVPFNDGQNWDEIIQRSRENILKKVSQNLGVEIASLIEEEDILEPRTIESKTGSHLGSLYGTSSNDRMAAFMRHANFTKKIKDLYFCGGSVHPGGGIPLCLLSARIVDELIHDAS